MDEISKKLVELCTAKDIKIAVAESCTGGMVASAITDVSGSSRVFDCGFISYSYESKNSVLKVCRELLKEHGAVSSVVASEMAIGAIKNSNADIALSVTGIAGPTGATDNKPVGLVYFATFMKGKVEGFEKHFSGDRKQVRLLATQFGLELLFKLATNF